MTLRDASNKVLPDKYCMMVKLSVKSSTRKAQPRKMLAAEVPSSSSQVDIWDEKVTTANNISYINCHICLY